MIEVHLIIWGIVISAIIFLILWVGISNNNRIKDMQENEIQEFGIYTHILRYEPNILHSFNSGLILANIDEDRILIAGNEYKISWIIGCKPSVIEASSHTTYTEKQVVKTNTGDALGRAIVGGLVAGGIGAIIGGTTAEKEIITIQNPHTTYTSNSYYLDLKFKDAPGFMLVRRQANLRFYHIGDSWHTSIKGESEYAIYRMDDFMKNVISAYNQKQQITHENK